MPRNRYASGGQDSLSYDNGGLLRVIQATIGNDLKMRYAAAPELPREMRTLIRRIERKRAKDK